MTHVLAASTSNGSSPGQIILGLVFLIVVVAAYWAPLIIALTRKLDNCVQIGLVTGLLGWTGIGWIVALVWSFKPVQASKPLEPPPGGPVRQRAV